ncbi:hypothetical protein [Accumulibacter sp.]|uniref:VMAP-C domain-containing protein n=1 Tax=Accumulibacter sp. TaxID=2053492 RepID=UPI001D92FD9D|nr:hypothetical protein [Accumulibacter sp.]MCB1968574.1 hypothetical protein [Accumulibacter sp.]MCP5227673.1 hypothetical protein [Accumulibacter sp.]
MPRGAGADREVVNAQGSQGFINRPTGPVTQHFGDNANVTINQGASVNEIVDALRMAGILSRLTTRIPEAQFRQLLDIVARVTLPDAGEHLYRVCRVTLPSTAHLVNAEIPSLLLADMCEQSSSKAWPPLFECIERFALVTGIEPALASEFQHWVDVSASLATPPSTAGEIENLRREIRAEALRSADADALSWLQVYLEPDWLNRTQQRKQALFRVELVLWSPRTNGPLVLQSEPADGETGEAKVLWTLDEIPSLLDQVFLRRETIALIPDIITGLVIEIVAPSDFLVYGFEHWKRKNTTDTYGSYHPLVVRLRDRLAIPDPADQKRADDYWHFKWNTFRNGVCRLDFAAVQWRPPEDLDTFELQDNPDLVCLGLSSPLLPGQREVFDTLRDAGIPIAIWLRGNDLGAEAPADWPQRIAASIRGASLSELREAVKKTRRLKVARKNRSYFSNALTLLWDDPDRPPLKYEAQGVFV